MTMYILVGAAEVDVSYLKRAVQNYCPTLIAVDKGYATLQAAGIKPDFVVGDFDSLGFVPQDGALTQLPCDKDMSDMEYALDYAFSQGATEVVLFGALGGRTDHALGNLELCGRFAERGLQVSAVGTREYAVFLAGPTSFDLPPSKGLTISLFSLTRECTGVYARGFKWPLENAALLCGSTLGLSNVCESEKAQVAFEKGTLALFVNLDT
jgi:thiamine pyrophosphokinase